MESDSVVLFVCVLIVGIAGLVGVVLWGVFRILYQTSGLKRLAERFQVAGEPDGQRFANQTIAIGGMRFRHCASAVVGPAGLYLKPWLAVPGVLVPWREVRLERQAEIYRRPAVELALGAPVAGRIRVFPELYATFQPYLGR